MSTPVSGVLTVAARVATITVSRRPFMWAHAADNVLRQALRPSLSLLAIHGDYAGWDAFTKPVHAVGIPVLVAFIDARVSAGELTNMATTQAAEVAPDALICKFDDDDYYGADYLSEMRNAWAAHPDAWILGKSAYTVRYVGGAKHNKTESYEGRIKDEAGHASNLAGSTFCIPAPLWNVLPSLRYPHIGLGCDGEFVQQADRVARTKGVQDPMPFYHVSKGEFFLLRYLNAWHGHDWNRPEDYA